MPLPSLRLISRDNGTGLSRDLALMADVLRAESTPVEVIGFRGNKVLNRCREVELWLRRSLRGRVRTQVFSERIYPRCLSLAERNLLVPNPEWFLPKWHGHLRHFDQVLCKTRHAEAIFQQLGCYTRYIGFTSEDRHDAGISRRNAFFHLAGRSSAKGTQVLLDTWRRHPEWPLLTVVQSPRKARNVVSAANIDHRVGYLGDAQLRRLQNEHAFHVCPSETEGFGHYLMEALSVGAVTLTTDAEPMNELVTEERGILIPYTATRANHLATSYLVDADGIEHAVMRALALSPERRWRLGRAARAFFLANDQGFRHRLRHCVYGNDAQAYRAIDWRDDDVESATVVPHGH